MRKQLVYLLSSIAILGMIGATADAATVRFTETNPIFVNPGSSLTLSLEGIGFADNADAGTITVNWDPAVLDYVQSASGGNPKIASQWDVQFVDDAKAPSGQIEYLDIATSQFGGVGPDFPIVDLMFNVIGAPGASTPVEVVDADPRFGGWFAPGAMRIPINYVAANVVVTPIPAAVWLMFSALGGLGLATRKKRSAPIIA